VSRTAQAALLAAALAAGTWAGGWTAVPLVAFLFGAWRREDSRAPLVAAVAAPAAWGALLAIAAARAPVLSVAERVGGLAGIPGVAVVALSLLFAAGLGWSAAETGRALMLVAMRRHVAGD
jgi:hypothetical protein